MNTRKLRKAILTLCSALLLVSLSVGITVAYLTDTEAVTNTFTVGKVGIKLTEAQINDEEQFVDADGNAVDDIADAARVQANSYKLYPGHTYSKDPVIEVDDNCDLAYLRVVVTFTNGAPADAIGLDMASIFRTFDETDYTGEGALWSWNGTWQETEDSEPVPAWRIEKATVGNDIVYTLTACTFIDGATSNIELFDHIVVPGELTNEQMNLLDGVQMNIAAYAVQADGFGTTDDFYTNADAAFAAAFEQW